MDRSPEDIAERIVTTWLASQRGGFVQGTAEEVGAYLGTVYTRALQAVKDGVSTVGHGLFEPAARE